MSATLSVSRSIDMCSVLDQTVPDLLLSACLACFHDVSSLSIYRASSPTRQVLITLHIASNVIAEHVLAARVRQASVHSGF